MKQSNIPEELKKMSIWCVWRLEERGKIPYNPVTGHKAKSNTISSFTTYDTACMAVSTGEYNGLGIGIFNGISAIDIDHCVDDGKISDMANDIINKMNSYTEISPSGTGIRIIFTIKDFEYDKNLYYIHNSKRGLEIYVSGATNKFVTITGNSIDDRKIVDGTLKLQNILDLYMKKPSSNTSIKPLNQVLMLSKRMINIKGKWKGMIIC